MINKITFKVQHISTIVPNDRRKVYGETYMKDASQQLSDISKMISNCASLVSYLNQYPDSNVRQAMGAHCGANNVDVTEHTKKRRTYNVHGMLWIHEEDK